MPPDTLYGEAKLAAEQALLRSGQPATVLRATGVYGPAGPGQRHKWAELFDDFARGTAIAPRAGTELHGDDLAAASRLAVGVGGGVFNVSDMMLDRRDLLAVWQEITGLPGDLPARADVTGYNEMDTARLRALGWRPGGMARLRVALRQMAEDAGISPKPA